jgi:hypothetical protein
MRRQKAAPGAAQAGKPVPPDICLSRVGNYGFKKAVGVFAFLSYSNSYLFE